MDSTCIYVYIYICMYKCAGRNRWTAHGASCSRSCLMACGEQRDHSLFRHLPYMGVDTYASSVTTPCLGRKGNAARTVGRGRAVAARPADEAPSSVAGIDLSTAFPHTSPALRSNGLFSLCFTPRLSSMPPFLSHGRARPSDAW